MVLISIGFVIKIQISQQLFDRQWSPTPPANSLRKHRLSESRIKKDGWIGVCAPVPEKGSSNKNINRNTSEKIRSWIRSGSSREEAQLTTSEDSSPRRFMKLYSQNRTTGAVRPTHLRRTRAPLTMGIWNLRTMYETGNTQLKCIRNEGIWHLIIGT